MSLSGRCAPMGWCSDSRAGTVRVPGRGCLRCAKGSFFPVHSPLFIPTSSIWNCEITGTLMVELGVLEGPEGTWLEGTRLWRAGFPGSFCSLWRNGVRPVPSLKGFLVAKALHVHGQTLISYSEKGGTPCKAANTKCWRPASCELEHGEALPRAEGGRCSYGYPGRCCQAQDPGAWLCRAPAKLGCLQTAAPGLAQLQPGCWQGFWYPQANQGLCPPGPEAHVGALDAQLHPCGYPHPPDLPPVRPWGQGSIPGGARLILAPCRAAKAAGLERCGRMRCKGCRLSLACSKRCREASRDLQEGV